MNNTVQSYIGKQSTEFLVHFIKQCIRGDYQNDYDYLIPYLLRVLIKRDDFQKTALKEILSME